MSYPHLIFYLRIDDTASFEEIVNRVAKVFNCTFVPSEDKYFEWWEIAVETTLLGMQITISYEPEAVKNSIHTYYLQGSIDERYNILWGETRLPNLSITDYILGLLIAADSEKWYRAKGEMDLRDESSDD